MTAPRFVVPGQTYLITRRCSERRFFLRPDARTVGIFEYCLAEAADRYGIRLIAWTTMSNHHHAVVEDPSGSLPDFLCHLHKMTARALNVRWGREEALWAAEPASAVRLIERSDILDKVIYTLANPVADHLVDRVLRWPGASSFAALDGRERRITRPRDFFRRAGDMPPTVSLRASTPTGWPGGAVAWAAAVRNGVEAKERSAEQVRHALGLRIAGRKAVLSANPEHRPSTSEPRAAFRPSIACKNLARRIAELDLLASFRHAYGTARQAMRAGLEAVFPWGTYRLARHYGVQVGPPST